MRNMAYAVTISKIDDIEGKDRIGLGHFEENAYTVIVPKTYKVGDVVCYFEVDSILPEEPRFEFLRKRCYNERVQGFLIKKMKIGKAFSYGLTMTSDDLGIKIEKGKVYDDILKVRKDEDTLDGSPKQFNSKIIKKSKLFPTEVISKCDEDNILNNPDLFNKIKKIDSSDIYTSIKLEGQSLTIFLEDRTVKDIIRDVKNDINIIYNEIDYFFKKVIHSKGNFITIINAFKKHFGNIKSIGNPFYRGKNLAVFGRNVEGTEENKKFAKRLIPLLYEHPTLILQGEYTSPKVQKGIYKNGENFNVFRAKENGKELTPPEFCEILNKANIEGVKPVEYIDINLKDFDLDSIQRYVDKLKFKEGDSKLDKKGNKYHEGIVIRTGDMRVHFKIKNREYKL